MTKENATKSNAIKIPKIEPPKGGGALKGIDEKFEVNAANGTASFSIPLPITPSRGNFQPQLSLNYNSGSGNSAFGLGWSLEFTSILRKTDKRIPGYDAQDVFMISGSEDLVPFLEKNGNDWIEKEYPDFPDFSISRYRPRIEGSFARIEKITHKTKGIYWKVTTRDNITTFYGTSNDSRILDPEAPTKIYEWLPEFSFDDKGNCMLYVYKKEDKENISNTSFEANRLNNVALFTNKYLKRAFYGNKIPYDFENLHSYELNLPDTKYLFELVLDYGEHTLQEEEIPSYDPITEWSYRQDAFSSYRSGFEIRTNRLCENILMFHHFDGEEQLHGYNEGGREIRSSFGDRYLIQSLKLEYKPSSINNSKQTEVSYLERITQTGYIRKDGVYTKSSLPPMEF